MSTLDERLAALERRIALLEERLVALAPSRPEPLGSGGEPAAADPAPPRSTPPRPAAAPPPRAQPAPEREPSTSATPPRTTPQRERGESFPLATAVLGLGGAAALVLAGMYLVQLAISSGWLTPVRQVAIAAIGGLALIGLGLALAGRRRAYAALLPATGVVILFLTIYGAHLYHGLIGAPLATGAVVAVCLGSLGLGTVFGHGMYVFFAVVGAYATPFLMDAVGADLTDLVLYYSAWSVLFCLHAVWQGSRSIYLVAMYLAVIGFDLIWRDGGGGGWATASIYQAIQFLVFTAGAVAFSLRTRQPMRDAEAWAHLPALLIFYALEYSILDEHLPRLAPWIAFASLLVILGAHVTARRLLPSNPTGSASIVGAYTAVVLFHAGYLELLPGGVEPWVVLGLAVAVAVAARTGIASSPLVTPSLVALGVAFFLNTMRVLIELDFDDVPAAGLLRWLYPATLYAGYGLVRETARVLGLRLPLLYAAHVTAMAAVAWQVDSSFLTSVGWGAIAVASLLVALRLGDRALARSSFIVFAFSGAKVLVYDLAGAAPLVRIGSLVALGVSLFVGGWLYQGVNRAVERRKDAGS